MSNHYKISWIQLVKTAVSVPRKNPLKPVKEKIFQIPQLSKRKKIFRAIKQRGQRILIAHGIHWHNFEEMLGPTLAKKILESQELSPPDLINEIKTIKMLSPKERSQQSRETRSKALDQIFFTTDPFPPQYVQDNMEITMYFSVPLANFAETQIMIFGQEYEKFLEQDQDIQFLNEGYVEIAKKLGILENGLLNSNIEDIENELIKNVMNIGKVEVTVFSENSMRFLSAISIRNKLELFVPESITEKTLMNPEIIEQVFYRNMDLIPEDNPMNVLNRISTQNFPEELLPKFKENLKIYKTLISDIRMNHLFAKLENYWEFLASDSPEVALMLAKKGKISEEIIRSIINDPEVAKEAMETLDVPREIKNVLRKGVLKNPWLAIESLAKFEAPEDVIDAIASPQQAITLMLQHKNLKDHPGLRKLALKNPGTAVTLARDLDKEPTMETAKAVLNDHYAINIYCAGMTVTQEIINLFMPAMISAPPKEFLKFAERITFGPFEITEEFLPHNVFLRIRDDRALLIKFMEDFKTKISQELKELIRNNIDDLYAMMAYVIDLDQNWANSMQFLEFLKERADGYEADIIHFIQRYQEIFTQQSIDYLRKIISQKSWSAFEFAVFIDKKPTVETMEAVVNSKDKQVINQYYQRFQTDPLVRQNYLKFAVN